MLKAQQRFSSLTQESSGCTDADLQGCYRQKQSNMSFLTNSKIHRAEEYLIIRLAWNPDSSKHWRLVENRPAQWDSHRKELLLVQQVDLFILSEADTEQRPKPTIIYMQGTYPSSGLFLLRLIVCQGTWGNTAQGHLKQGATLPDTHPCQGVLNLLRHPPSIQVKWLASN